MPRGAGCDQAAHDRLKRSTAEFERGTYPIPNGRAWPGMVVANCKDCDSTIARTVDQAAFDAFCDGGAA